MPWDENNVSKLKELWDQGLPTAQIGKLLGFTKNAVVGKAHRIGLERRPSPIRRTSVKPDRKKARSPVMPKLNFENNNPENKPDDKIAFHPAVKNLLSNSTKIVNILGGYGYTPALASMENCILGAVKGEIV